MVDRVKKINSIQELRNARSLADQAAYDAGLRLLAAQSQRRKTIIGESGAAADQAALVEIKAKIAHLEQVLLELGQQIAALNAVTTKLTEEQNLRTFLQKRLQTLLDLIVSLQTLIATEKARTIPNKETLDGLNNQLGEAQLLLVELQGSLATINQKIDQLQAAHAQAIASKQGLEAQAQATRIEVAQLEQALHGSQQVASQGPNVSEQEIKVLQSRYDRLKGMRGNTAEQLHIAIQDLYLDQYQIPHDYLLDLHPRPLVEDLSDNIPFLMLPLRIETRFMEGGKGKELWVRAYPDDIAVHTHEKTLTSAEVIQGRIYWKALFGAIKAGGAGAEDAKKAAWKVMVDRFGAARCAWIANETKPLNWTEDFTGKPNADDLKFPEMDLDKPNSWSRAPRTHMLPDKLVVMLYEGTKMVKEVVGRPIPDELFLGPDPLEADGGFVTEDNKLLYGDSFNWTSNFEKAVAQGMGFRIPITNLQATQGFDKVLVMGLLLSADETQSQKQVEELIDNHHYAAKGFSLVGQGTPTNNTDEAMAGFSSADPFASISYFVETGQPLFDPDLLRNPDCDGKLLADALGIDYAPLQYVANAEKRDVREAVDMNAALYAGTLGYYFKGMLNKVLRTATLDKLRDFFVEHVTGRGPLPAIRVGKQPYGVLLTSDFSQWSFPRPLKPTPSTAFQENLFQIIRYYHGIWEGLLPKVSYVGKPNAAVDEVLMNVMGLHPGSVEFYQRIAYSTDYLQNLSNFQFGGKYYEDMKKSFTSKANLLNFFQDQGLDVGNVPGGWTIPQLLRLVFQHYHSTLDAANLVEAFPLSEKRGLHRMHTTGNDQRNYIQWLAEVDSVDDLETHGTRVTRQSHPTSLLYLMMRRSLLLQLHDTTVRWFAKGDISLEDTLLPRNFHNVRADGDLSRWEVLRGNVGIAQPNHVQQAKPAAELLLTNFLDPEESQFLSEMRTAMGKLAGVDTASLERLFTDHLDTCTYRLDAWETGLFDHRLKQMRGTVPGANGRQKGLYLGAFGWVENLKPSAKQKVVADAVHQKLQPKHGASLVEYSDNGGFVHAPSLAQASAAAVLRAGYMSHATPAEPETMAVNLSSDRVRRALFILQGIRNGQRLEALLGYQFERGLHDRASADDGPKELNAYIYDFRDAYPISSHLLMQQGSNVAVDQIPANEVVNGVLLADKTGGFPFGAKGNVLSASAAAKAAIVAEHDLLADTLDAVKDLMLSETVYQLVQGNFERTSALVNALKDSKIPPEIDIINTPRGTQFAFTNRVTIHFENLDPALDSSNPWLPVPMSPRANMEPGLNKWLGTLLGDPKQIWIKATAMDAKGNVGLESLLSLDQLRVQPLDLLYILSEELNTGADQSSGESRTAASELESRYAFLFRNLNGLGDDQKIQLQFLEPASSRTVGSLLPMLRMLKGMITDARAVNAEDYSPPSKVSLGDPNNRKGYAKDQLATKAQGAIVLATTLLSEINALAIQAEIVDKNGLSTTYFNLGDIFEGLNEAKLDFGRITWTFDLANAVALQQLLIAAANLGLKEAWPQVSGAGLDPQKLSLLNLGMAVAAHLARAIQRATQLKSAANAATTVDAAVSGLVDAIRAIHGDAFVVIPQFFFANEADILSSHNDRPQLLKFARNTLKMDFPADEWMQTVAQVRPKLRRWEYIRLLHETEMGGTLELNPVQLPYRALDNWLAVEFPAMDETDPTKPFTIMHDTIAATIHGAAAFQPGARQSGLLIDDWTEMIPVEEELTGISFHYNQPNATPPQTLLLAVPPVMTGNWSWDALVGILNDTLHRAKLRAVEPALLDAHAKGPETGILLPAILSEFTEHDLDISLDMRTNLSYFANLIPMQIISLNNG